MCDMMCYSQNNWKQIQNQSLKQGPFTANEDDIIINKLLEALTEYGKLPRGIWVQISHGLNRDLNSVYEHWRQILSKKNLKQIIGTSTSCDIINQPVTSEEVLATINMMMINENNSNMIGQQHDRKYDVNVEKAFLNQKRKKEPHEIRTKWTPAMVRDSMNIYYYTILY